MERVSKRNYYLDIAQTVLERATCLRRVAPLCGVYWLMSEKSTVFGGKWDET